MHHLVIQSNFVDAGPDAIMNRFGGNDSPVCPKPRHPGSGAIPELLAPLKCSRHSRATSDGRSGILNMITGKTTDDEQEPVCNSVIKWIFCHHLLEQSHLTSLASATQHLQFEVWLQHLSISGLSSKVHCCSNCKIRSLWKDRVYNPQNEIP